MYSIAFSTTSSGEDDDEEDGNGAEDDSGAGRSFFKAENSFLISLAFKTLLLILSCCVLAFETGLPDVFFFLNCLVSRGEAVFAMMHTILLLVYSRRSIVGLLLL